MAFEPAARPRFGPAARALMRTLQAQAEPAERAQTLRELCGKLGDEWFPFFLKLLMVVGEGAPEDHRKLLADSVAHGLQHGQPAAGTLSSWGITAGMPPAGMPTTAGTMFLRHARARPLDPLSYLAVWYGQGTARPRIPAHAFERAVVAILRLFSASNAATSIYQAKLDADILAAADGTYSTATLRRLRKLLEGWREGASAARLASAVAAEEPVGQGFGNVPLQSRHHFV
jgi:hypothetical protein